jgi:CRP-like cAMP-binding protein
VLFDETTVLGMLPVKLRADVKLDMYSDAVDAIPFLPMGQADSTGTSSSVNLEVIRLVIAGILKPVTFMDREVLVHEGQRGHEMFIIIHGTVEVTVDGCEDVLMLLGVCDCFGELSCLEPDRMWGHTVVSSGFTSVAKIERVELDW